MAVTFHIKLLCKYVSMKTRPISALNRQVRNCATAACTTSYFVIANFPGVPVTEKFAAIKLAYVHHFRVRRTFVEC